MLLAHRGRCALVLLRQPAPARTLQRGYADDSAASPKNLFEIHFHPTAAEVLAARKPLPTPSSAPSASESELQRELQSLHAEMADIFGEALEEYADGGNSTSTASQSSESFSPAPQTVDDYAPAGGFAASASWAQHSPREAFSHQPKALGVIPARLGSSRFPGKPLAEFFGKTMIEHTYAAASGAALLGRVLVATDSERIRRVLADIGGDAVLTSGACATGTDRVVQVLEAMDPRELSDYDVVVNIQGDEPGVNPRHIDACVAALRGDPASVMSTLATPIRSERDAVSRDVVKCVVDHDGNALYFSRALIPHSKSGAFSPETTTYLRHVGLYAFRTDFLLQFPSLPVSPLEASEDLEQLRVLSAGHKIKIVQVDATLPGVDTREELDALKAQWPTAAQ